MKKLSIFFLMMAISLFALPSLADDGLFSLSSVFEEGKEVRDISLIDRITTPLDFSLSSSVTIEDTFEVAFVELIRDFIADTSSISYRLLDGTNPREEFQNLPHGLVVDPEGKMWVGFYGGLSREFQCDDGRVINLRAIHCFMSDGTPAPFSPMEFFDFPDSTRDTLYYESATTGSCRGLSTTDDGNILLTSWSTLIKIDYRNGQGLARWHPEMNGFGLGSMTEAAHDPDQGLIYIGRVIDQQPVYMLDEDLNYLGTAIDTVPTLHRSILARTKDDGTSQIFSGTIWDGQGIFVYESPDPRTVKFQLVDTLANEVVTNSGQMINYMAWPSCMDWYDREEGILLYGNLYCALALSNSGETLPAKHQSKWTFLDVDDNRQMGTFGVKTRQGGLYSGPYGEEYPNGSFSPRGASFVGDYIYTIDFNISLLQKWQIMDFADTLMLSLNVSDSTDSARLHYGWAEGATDDFDPGLDEEDSLIAPEGSFDAHFGGGLTTSFKAPDYRRTMSWDLSFQAGDDNGPAVVEWDKEAFPNYGNFYLRDTLDGSLVELNMRDTASYVAGRNMPSNLRIFYFYSLMADFYADVTSAKAPGVISFVDRSVGAIKSWHWDFGDGSYSDEKDPVHTYSDPGVYHVTLTVSDGQNSDEIYKTSYITIMHSDQPVILDVRDHPDDQGGWVLVDFRRSGYDTAIPGTQDSSTVGLETYNVEISEDESVWIPSNSMVAYGSENYTIMVNTLHDSSASFPGMTYFRVTANMVEGQYTSVFGSGYSVDNIAPPAPGGLSIEKNSSGIDIAWEISGVEDLKHFNVYRSLDGEFGEDGTLLASTEQTCFTDHDLDENNTYYYRITAVDIHDNEGKESEIVSQTVGLGDIDLIPDNFELIQNYPNPFNPTTTLTYGLPEASDVMIMIFDISGKKIMEWNLGVQQGGWHHVVWNGRNSFGDPVSSGMYIYKLCAGTSGTSADQTFIDTKKMLLMK